MALTRLVPTDHYRCALSVEVDGKMSALSGHVSATADKLDLTGHLQHIKVIESNLMSDPKAWRIHRKLYKECLLSGFGVRNAMRCCVCNI